MGNIFLHFHLNAFDILAELHHLVIDILRAGGHASCSGTDKDTAGIGVDCILNFLLAVQKIVF